MEFHQNTRPTTTWPVAWFAAIVFALVLGLMSWSAMRSGAPTPASNVLAPFVPSIQSARLGGPGGQIGDAPQPGLIARIGGPGGQIGDAPQPGLISRIGGPGGQFGDAP